MWKEVIQQFLDQRDLGRPLKCTECPVASICFLHVGFIGYGPSSDKCRHAWAEIREWVSEQEAKELVIFSKTVE